MYAWGRGPAHTDPQCDLSCLNPKARGRGFFSGCTFGKLLLLVTIAAPTTVVSLLVVAPSLLLRLLFNVLLLQPTEYRLLALAVLGENKCANVVFICWKNREPPRAGLKFAFCESARASLST